MSARSLTALLAAPALLAIGCAQAQTAQPVVTVPPRGEPEPARLAAAQKVVVRLVPEGIYKRMLGDNFSAMMGAAMDSVGDMPAQQLVRLTGMDLSAAQKLGEGKVSEVLEIYDPNWQKRMTATTTAFSAIMTKIATEMEPSIRKALSRAYAREFSLAELAEMERFFATPAGGHYAAKSLEITMDSEMVSAMTEMMPKIMAQIPDMAKQMEAVEATLPKRRKFKELTPAEQKRVTALLGVDAETLEAADLFSSDDAMTTEESETATPPEELQ